MTRIVSSLWQSWRRPAGLSPAGRSARPRKPRTRLTLEGLEDRTTPGAGALDPSFGIGGMVTTNVPIDGGVGGQSVALQSDGKIVVAGFAHALGWTVMNHPDDMQYDFVVRRYNADGSLDTTFGTAGRQTIDFGFTYDFARGVAVQPDGKIVVAGFTVQYTEANGITSDFAVARLNRDGSLDPTFDGDGRQTIDFDGHDHAAAVAVQADGTTSKIVIAGETGRHVATDSLDFAVARLSRDGSLDPTFDGDGRQTIDFGATVDGATALAVQPDGTAIVAGLTVRYGGADGITSEFAVARLNTGGSLDPMFDGDGRQTIGFGSFEASAAAVDVQADGKVVVAGSSDQYAMNEDFAVARLNRDGSLDASFDGDGRQTIDFGATPEIATAVAVQPDGRIVVAGYSFQAAIGHFVFAVAWLNTNGSPDASFDGDGRVTTFFGPIFAIATGVAVQADGRIVVAGAWHTGSWEVAVARYLGDNAPPQAVSQEVSVPQYGSGSITLTGTDAETPSGQLVFTVTSLPGSGTLYHGTTPVQIGDTFIGPPTLRYELNAGAYLKHIAFTFTVTDGGGLTSDPATVVLNVVPAPRYGVTPLTDLGRPFQNTVPIRLRVTDAAGANVSSPSLHVTALGLARVTDGVPGPRLPAAGVGNANPGGVFRYDADLGGYVFHLNAKGLAAGKYVFFFVIEGDPTVHEFRFTLK